MRRYAVRLKAGRFYFNSSLGCFVFIICAVALVLLRIFG